MPGNLGPFDAPDITAQINQVKSQIPSLASSMPMTEATGGSAGSASSVPRSDHQHPRLSSTAEGALDIKGEAVITFTRRFSNKPAVSILMVEGADNSPITFKVKSWTMDGTDYVGCVIKGYRGQQLPTLTTVSGILTAVITGINLVVNALTGFNPFGGVASGAEFSLIAIQKS